MKAEELAFVNRQLAGMLRAGIPLEGALRQLCADMQRGELRRELELLVADLAQGTSFRQAIASRKLPAFYVQMLHVGVASNDLPGVLTLVADYYERSGLLHTRIKGLMVYPEIVLIGTLLVSVWLTYVLNNFGVETIPELFGSDTAKMAGFAVVIWTPLALLVVATVVINTSVLVRPFRRWLRWRFPGTREASLSQAAGALAAMLKGGCTLPDGIRLLQELEGRTPAGRDLAGWSHNLSQGATSFAEIAKGSDVFPPLFVSLVANSPEDVALGFEHAAAVYEARAIYRSEMLLQAALPAAVIVLGALICSQMMGIVFIFTKFLDALGGT